MHFRYRVYGTVVEAETERPLAGVVVRGFDKDLLFDDALGATTTDESGAFELLYTDDAFRSIVDEKPDLYLQVWDASNERLLHTTQDAIRWNANNEERYDIRIAPSALGPAEPAS
jgi:hypothetical protein